MNEDHLDFNAPLVDMSNIFDKDFMKVTTPCIVCYGFYFLIYYPL